MTAALLALCVVILALLARFVMAGDLVALGASAFGLFQLARLTGETLGRP